MMTVMMISGTEKSSDVTRRDGPSGILAYV